MTRIDGLGPAVWSIDLGTVTTLCRIEDWDWRTSVGQWDATDQL